MRGESASVRDRLVAWVRQHQRAVGIGVTGSALALVGVAAVLGWAILAGPQLAGDADATPSDQPTASGKPTDGPSRSPIPTSSPAVSPVSPPTSSSATFSLLPAQQPADFVSQITCSGSIGPSDPVAIVQLHADPYTGELALRDYADTSNPRTTCTIGEANNRVVQLIDSRHLVITWYDFESGGDTYAVVDLPEVAYHWFQLPPYTSESYSTFIAISPQLDEIVWLKERPGTVAAPMVGSSREIHITTSKGDRVVASLPDTLTGFCGAPPDYSKRGAFSLSGTHLVVLDHPHVEGANAMAMHSLRVFQGEVPVMSLVPPSAGWAQGEHPAQAVWSPTSDTLYYRQGGDVWQWTLAGGPSVFLPGVDWYYPTLTPDGSHMAYVLEGDGQYDVYLIDLAAGGSPQLIGQARERPVFLNDAQLWFTIPSVTGCVTGDEEPFIYNIIDRSEAPSIIDRVLHVWPATSAWY